MKRRDQRRQRSAALFSSIIKQQVVSEKIINAIIRKYLSESIQRLLLCTFYKGGQCNKEILLAWYAFRFTVVDIWTLNGKLKRSIFTQTPEMKWTKPRYHGRLGSGKAGKCHWGDESNNSTDIVCKHFIEAVEIRKPRLVWSCMEMRARNRHALPPGWLTRPGEHLKVCA
jgi:hypothetical protein